MKPSDFFSPHPRPVSLACRPDHVVAIEFDNGEHGLLDMKPYLDRGVFRELREPAAFRTARITAGTVAWDHDIDLHPAFVYHRAVTYAHATPLIATA